MVIKAIMLDVDFTLVDASKGIYLCITNALKVMGYTIPDYNKCISTIGFSLPETFKLLTKCNSLKEIDRFEILFVKHAKKVLIDNTIIYNTVKPFLKKAVTLGYKLGIITSKYRHPLNDILNKFKLNKFFSFHIAGDEIEHIKPHPMSIEKALIELNVTKEESIYVGDSLVDAEAANRAGIKFIAVLTGQTCKDAFLKYKPFAVISDLSMLLEVLA